MANFFGILTILMVFCMLLGLVRPSIVLRGAQKQTRLRALAWYGFFAFLSLGALGATLPETTPPPVTEVIAPASPVDPAQAELAAKQEAERVKGSVRRVMAELLALDEPGSDAAGFARSMAQATGKSVGLGDVFGAFKAAKLAADDSFSRLMAYKVPSGLPANVQEKLDAAHVAFRRAAMLRSDIAEIFMEWLDTRKPSLENAMQEKSGQVTLAMTKAIVSLTEAMTAAGFNDDEVKAQLAAMSGQEQAGPAQADAGKPGKKKKGQ